MNAWYLLLLTGPRILAGNFRSVRVVASTILLVEGQPFLATIQTSISSHPTYSICPSLL